MERLIRFSLCRRWLSDIVWTLTALAVLLPSSHLFGQSATETAVDSTDAGSQDDTVQVDSAQRFIRLERWLAIEQERVRWYARVVKQLEQTAESVRAELPAEKSDGGPNDVTDSEEPAIALETILQLNQLATEQKAVVEQKLGVQRAMLDVFLEPVVDLPASAELPSRAGTEPNSASESAATESAGERDPSSSADSGSEPDASETQVIANPLQAALAQGDGNQEAAKAAATETSPESFDPYLTDVEAKLADAVQKLDVTNEQAALQSRAIRLSELDYANVSRWIELAQATESVNASSENESSQALKAEAATVYQTVFDEGLQKHQQWKSLLTEQIESWQDSREEAVASISGLESEIASLRMRAAFLRSPLAPHRIQRWLLVAGPYALLILVIGVAVWLISRPIVSRTARTVAKHRRTGTLEERQERAETLRRMIQGIINLTLTVVVLLALLDQFGVDVTVLLGGAAVLGMAIAFGAQNLIKDYFGGLLILTENQYRVGNVIRVGGIAGLVEDVSLRMTTLRDLEGIAHFIPHGQIATVSNLSHGWSRTVLDIGVAYKENVDHVMDVLREVTDAMYEDPYYGTLLLDRAEILGVDALSDSAVVIKFMVKTRPLKQWEVKRELLRRIKNRFDELGIEIPFPHRTVYHRSEAEALATQFADQATGDGSA